MKAEFHASTSQRHTKVDRGCVWDVREYSPTVSCHEFSFGPGDENTFCSYCCEGALCNADGFQEIADGFQEAADGFPEAADAGFQEAADAVLTPRLSCWHCSEDIAKGMSPSPMSCLSDDFNGESALAVPCETQCVVGVSMVLLPRYKLRTLRTLLRRIEML